MVLRKPTMTDNPTLSAPNPHRTPARPPTDPSVPDSEIPPPTEDAIPLTVKDEEGLVTGGIGVPEIAPEFGPGPPPAQVVQAPYLGDPTLDPEGNPIVVPQNALNTDDPGKTKKLKFVKGVHPASRLTY